MVSQTETRIAWCPDLLFVNGRFERDMALICDADGTIAEIARTNELTNAKRIALPSRAMLPGMVNAHSHAFQRVLRGRTEFRSFSSRLPAVTAADLPKDIDSFWTWREMMYSAASRLTAEDVYDVSRMAFLEMALGGITAVGEFHYLHHAPEGNAYDDPNLLAKEVIRAAGDVGLRIALLRVAYARSGFRTDANPQQRRFIEKNPETFLQNVDRLGSDISVSSRHGAPTAWIGVAPHSVRALPLDYLKQVISYADKRGLKVHMHVAEQPAEVSACVEEYGRTPIALLQTEGCLSERFTAVHAVHVTSKAIPAFAKTGAMVCACPTTERNLGDGVVPADEYLRNNVPICLGTDSHAQIDLLEDARELEYHLRLQKLERAVLAVRSHGLADIASQLFDCATINGARSIGSPNGILKPGKPADFFTVALDDPAIAGASVEDLLVSIVFASSRATVREVVIDGRPVVSEGQHLVQEEILERFTNLQKRLWG